MNRQNQHTGFISRLNAWLLHKGADRYNRWVEKRKQRLFAGLAGQVLEIGPGTGTNLPYYPEEASLTGLEPNPYMQKYLTEKAGKLERQIEIITVTAENIPLEDESIDTVVSTLVLCSVEDQQQVLLEIQRVLKPGGRFLFLEHVAAPGGTFLRTVQRGIKPLWRWIADGCRPDRETWKTIKDTGFEDLQLEHFRLPLPVIGPHIIGTAVKTVNPARFQGQ